MKRRRREGDGGVACGVSSRHAVSRGKRYEVVRRCRPGYSLVESAAHDDRVITNREKHGRSGTSKRQGEDMRHSRPGRWPDGAATIFLVGVAVLLFAAGCDRGDAKSSKQAPAAPTQTVSVVEVPQRTVSVGADFVAR